MSFKLFSFQVQHTTISHLLPGRNQFSFTTLKKKDTVKNIDAIAAWQESIRILADERMLCASESICLFEVVPVAQKVEQGRKKWVHFRAA